jgi:hypothetical protein
MVPTNLYAFIPPSLPRRRPAGRSRPLAAAFFPMPTFGRSPYPLLRRLNLSGPTMVSAPNFEKSIPARVYSTQAK